jgi:hypothetical protein
VWRLELLACLTAGIAMLAVGPLRATAPASAVRAEAAA